MNTCTESAVDRLQQLAATHPVDVRRVIDRAIAGVVWQSNQDVRRYGEHLLTIHHVELIAARQRIEQLQIAAEKSVEVLHTHGYTGHAELLRNALKHTRGTP